MRKVALLTCLTLATAVLAGIAGMAAAAVADSGSALVVVVVVVLGALIIGLLEWTHRRGSGLVHAVHGADLGVSAGRQGVRDRDTMRALDELRAARAHEAGPASPPVGRDPHRRNGTRRHQPRPALRLSTASDRHASHPIRCCAHVEATERAAASMRDR